jgi:hypothetical protein
VSDTVEPTGQILRDYLYVDIDKVKSIAGQLESGVPEEARLTSRDAKRTTIGWRGVLSYGPESDEEAYIQRSMLDSLFPELEDVLEQGWLEDISDIFSSDRLDKLSAIRSCCPEGSIFRLTADGYLFDVRHFATLFANVSATLNGYQEFERAQKALAEKSGSGRAGGPKGQREGRAKPRTNDATAEKLEDFVEDFSPQAGISPQLLRAMIHTARGVFSPGLNLMMNTADATGKMNISALLQDNRRYLDASPSVVASRFGVSAQPWTLVATVGHYSSEPDETGQRKIAMMLENATSGAFNRNRFVRTVNSSIEDMSQSGLTELPQHPGMAAVPIAVYRAVRRSGPVIRS